MFYPASEAQSLASFVLSLVGKKLHHFQRDRQVLHLASRHHSSNCHATQVLETGNMFWSCPEVHASILRPAHETKHQLSQTAFRLAHP